MDEGEVETLADLQAARRSEQASDRADLPRGAPASVGRIVEQVGLSQSLVSHHLRLLRATRLLKAGRQGRQVLYSLPDCHVRDMLTNLIDHVAEPREHGT